MRAFILAAAASLTLGAPLAAQERIQNYASITSYVFSVPSGDTRGFLTSPSWLGLTWDGLWAVGASTAAGVSLGVHDFNRSSFGTSNFTWGAATGQEVRTLVVTTAMATGRWYPEIRQTRRLHVGLSTGLTYATETYQLGLSESIHGAAHIAIAPEAGWSFPLGNGVAGELSARYTLSTSNGRYVGGSRSYPFATLGFGLFER